MTDHKFTDDEIIRAAQCCFLEKRCEGCPLDRGVGNASCIKDLHSAVLDLFKRQKVEIEAMKIANEKMYSANKEQEAAIERLNKCIKTEDEVREIMKSQMLPMVREITVAQIDRAKEIGRIEAIKEFAERLKNIYLNDKRYDCPNPHTLLIKLFDNIDTLVKEMMEGANNA